MSLPVTLSLRNDTPDSVADAGERHRRWLRWTIWFGCLLAVAAAVVVVVQPLFVRWQLKQHGWSIGNELPHGGFPSWCPKFVATWFGRVDYANAHRTPLPEDVRRLRSFPHLNFLEFQNTDVSLATLEATFHLSQVRTLAMNGGRIDEPGLGYLASLPQLERLEFMRAAPLNERALESIASCSSLERLAVVQTPMDNNGLVHLQKLHRLWSLYLSGINFGDRGFENVSHCAQLRRLGLDRSLITDASVSCLSRMTNLQTLEFSECNLTDAAAKELVHCAPQLTTLRLDCRRMTDEAITEISRLPALQELHLWGMPITDHGILQLKKQASLRLLRLSHTKVTSSGVEELKRANPKLEIGGFDLE